jgi:hypothetical protein
MSRRGKWLALAVVVTSLVGLTAGAGWLYSRFFGDPTENSMAYMGLIRVDAGYRDISAYHDGSDSCNCVQHWYIGPAQLDPMLWFTGPGLVWVPATGTQPPEETGWHAVAYADPTTPRTGRCHVDLDRETSNYSYSLDDGVRISTEQASGWLQGNLDVIEVDVACDRDANRL